LVLLILLE